MLAPTFPALTGLGPLLPGSGGISLESIGESCDTEDAEDGCGLDLFRIISKSTEINIWISKINGRIDRKM